MKRYWSNRARKITPYTAGEQPKRENIIKLNTNENPYPPSRKAVEVLQAFDKDRLRLYPNAGSDPVCEAAAKLHGVTPQQIFCGNGSDEVLAIAFQAFFDGDLVFPDITYSFYPVWADLYGIDYETAPLTEEYTIPVSKLKGKKNIIFPNPNAPTSIALTRSEVEEIVKSAKGVVVVDEAYADFSDCSVIDLTQKYDNLLVVRTLSKSHALAGLRVGYAVGNAGLIQALNCIKDSFNSYPLDALAQAAATAALLDQGYTSMIVEKIKASRDKLALQLTRLGFRVLPAQANFVFCRPENGDAQELLQQLRERGIYVRWFSGERVREFLRITVGTEQQNEALVLALKEILKK